jgi:hypothetical protein
MATYGASSAFVAVEGPQLAAHAVQWQPYEEHVSLHRTSREWQLTPLSVIVDLQQATAGYQAVAEAQASVGHGRLRCATHHQRVKH